MLTVDAGCPVAIQQALHSIHPNNEATNISRNITPHIRPGQSSLPWWR